MSNWVQLTEAEVADSMPADMIPVYDAWIVANPDKADRLAELTAEAVAVCRTAVASGSPWALDPDETKIPTSGFRHMINTVIFNLGMEMSFDFVPDFYSLVTRADIWLRGVQIGSITVPAADGTLPSPSYEPPEDGGRVLNG